MSCLVDLILGKINRFKKEKDKDFTKSNWTSEDGSSVSNIDDDFQRLIKLNRSGIYRRGTWKGKIKR